MNERKYQRNQEILRLREQGLSIRAIAAGCAKSTVVTLAHADEFSKLPPSLSIGFDSDPQKIARQIFLLSAKPLPRNRHCLRAEAPLTTKSLRELEPSPMCGSGTGLLRFWQEIAT